MPLTDPKPARANVLRYLAEVAALAALFVLAVKVSQAFAWVNGYVAPVWLPAGVSVAALSLRGKRLWPGVALGTVASGFLRGAEPSMVAAFAAVNAIEAVAAAWLLSRLKFERDLSRMRGVVCWLTAGTAAAALSATLGVLAICLHLHSFAGGWHMWHVWWAGNSLGCLALGAFIVAWSGARDSRVRAHAGEGAVLLLALAGICYFAFSGLLAQGPAQPLGFLVFPFQIWAAVRLGPRGATSVTLVALLVAVMKLSLELNGAPAEAVHQPLLLLQVFVVVLSTTGLVLAAATEERARAEEQSRLLLSAIGASADGVLIGQTDAAPNPRILFANEAIGALMGVPSRELIGAPTDLVRRRALTGALDDQAVKSLREGRSMTGELEIEAAVGRRRIEWQLSPVPDDSGRVRHFVSIQRDVTQRKAAERALRWNEALLRTITAAAPSALFVFDERSGTVLYFNQRFIDLWCIEDLKERMKRGEAKADDVLERNLLLVREQQDLLRPLGIDAAEDELALRDGRTLRRFSTRITDAEGRYFGKLLVFEDVTSRKRAEVDVVRSRERYRALVSSLPDTILRISMQGRLLDAFVPGDCALLGSVDEALDKPLGEALPAPLAASLLESAAGALTGGGTQSCNERVDTKAGRRYIEARVVKSGPDEALAILRDVTDHREMQAKLLLSDRMASVGTLAAGVAHEINNPLSFVMANQSLLIEHVQALLAENPSARLNECMELLQESAEGAERVRRIVRDLKIFSRHDEEGVGPVDLRHVVDRAVALAWNEIRHKARLIKQYGEVPLLSANEARLGQVLVNLVVNAAQAIPDGDADGNSITIATRVEGDCAVVEVKDTGCGIPQENVARIFDPFFTTKPVGVGTGLGLAICHQIVVAQGGDIEVETAKGKGSCFRVRLPLFAAAEAKPARPAAAPAAEAPRRSSILIVDDEAMVARSVSRVLAHEHHVESAGSGREALRLLGEGKRYDVILCDLMMPELSGMELYEQLGRLEPELATRMVFLTGGAFTQSARSFLENVRNPRLEKPFDLEELKKVVRSVAAS